MRELKKDLNGANIDELSQLSTSMSNDLNNTLSNTHNNNNNDFNIRNYLLMHKCKLIIKNKRRRSKNYQKN